MEDYILIKEMLIQYCNDNRLSDDDIVELFDTEGVIMNKEIIQNQRKEIQREKNVFHE